MSAIFLSHSSADTDRAHALKRALEARGHTVFLDFDPESGIAGGSDWEKTLYDRLQVCQAVVALISPDWITSHWCFAEVFHARASGKVIVPVKIRAYDQPRPFSQLQEIDLTQGEQAGLRRLQDALEDIYPLMPGRPPYPGLASFMEEDAAVFCGRDPEISAGQELLESLRLRGRSAARLVLVLGASGSGKSSLVRAGFLPRLRRRPSNWLMVPVVRPRASALDELAVAWSAAYATVQRPRDWREIAAALRGPAASGTASPIFLDMARDLRAGSGRLDATVLLVIDQAEELFGSRRSHEADACLRLLRDALERADTELLVIATIRSDFLGTFQGHPFLSERAGSTSLAYEKLTVDPMPASRIGEVIRGPASRFGIEVDDRLIEQLSADIRSTTLRGPQRPGGGYEAQTTDALPLLAFALRRLWTSEEQRRDGRLDLQDYADAGQLQGVIENAATEALKRHPPVTAEELQSLRAAFIPGMVQVTTEGVRTRRRASLDDMPVESRPLLDRLVEARLLVTDVDHAGRPTIEVTHEAVFRMWSRLEKWLDEDQYKLQVLEGIARAAREWDAATRRDDLLVHRDGRLSEVLAVLGDRADAFARRTDVLSRDYLEACRRAQQQRDEAARDEQARRVRDARTIWRRTAIGAASAVVLLVAVLAGVVVLFRVQASALDRQRFALAKLWVSEDPTIAALILNEVHAPLDLPALEVAGVSFEILSSPMSVELMHDGPVRWVDGSPDGKAIATASADGTARIWRVDGSQPPRVLRLGADVLRVVISPDGKTLATSALDGSVQLWSMVGGGPVAKLDHGGQIVLALAFSPNSEALLTGAFDGAVRIWSLGGGPRVTFHSMAGSNAPVVAVAFDSDAGRLLAASREDRKVRVWNADGSDAERPVECKYPTAVVTAAFGPGRTWFAAVTKDGELHRATPEDVRRGAGCGQPAPGPASPPEIVGAAFGPLAARLVTLQKDGSVVAWNGMSRGNPQPPPARRPGARSVAFAPSGEEFVTTHDDGAAYVWRFGRAEAPLVLARHRRPVQHAVFGSAGALVVTASDDGAARVWPVSDDALAAGVSVTIKHPRSISDVSFTRDGQRVLTSSNRGDVRLSDLTGRKVVEFAHPSAGARHSVSSPKGDRVVSVGNDGHARVWKTDEAKGRRGRSRTLTDEQDPENEVLHARFGGDGGAILTGSADGTARIWNAEDAALPPIRLGGHDRGKPLTAAEFDATGSRVVTASTDGTARLWDARTGKEERVLPHGAGVAVLDAAFSGDGRWIVTAASDKAARVWRADASPPVVLRHPADVHIAAFSPDGQRVLTVSADGIVRVWPRDGARSPLELVGHDPNARIVSAEFSPNGTLVLTASNDGTARVWKADGTGDPIVLRQRDGLVRASFNPGGDKIVTGSRAGRATIWTFAVAQLLDTIRARTRACLTPDFRVRYLLERAATAERAHRDCESHRISSARP